MQNPDIDGALMPLPEALRALPQVAPEHSAWPQLAARLSRESEFGLRRQEVEANSEAGPKGEPQERRANRESVSSRRVRHWFVPAALAAGIVLAVIAAPLLHRTAQVPGPQPSALGPQLATVAQPAASSSANAANTTNATNVQTPADAGAQLAALQQRSQALEHWLHETARAAAPLSGQDLAAATEIEDMIGLVDVQLGAQTRNGDLPLWRHRVDLLEDLTALRYSSYSLAASGVDAKTLMPTTWTN